MRIINEDLKDNIYELKIETLDDLWILNQILNKEDIIFSTSKRKININGKSITKTLYLEVQILKTEFNTNNLRIQGTILNENEFVQIGKSHSIIFEIGSIIKFKYEKFLKYQKKLFENSIKNNKNKSLVILFDKSDLIVFQINDFSYTFLFEENNLGSKKYYLNNIDDYEEKISLLKTELQKNYSNIFICSPAIFLEKMEKVLISKKIDKKKIIKIIHNDISKNSISNIISKINKSNLFLNSKMKEENELLEKFLFEISKTEKVVYGKKEVFDTINLGNVSDMIITTKFIQKNKEENTFLQINENIQNVENLSSNIHILDSNNKNGKIIDGFLGICLIKKY